MDTVIWAKFKHDEYCNIAPKGKLHFTEDLGHTTLCGVNVPSSHDAEIEGEGDRHYVECKRCQKAHDKLARESRQFEG